MQKYYCFPCTIFGGDEPYGKEGSDVIKNFEAKATKHEISRKHIMCSDYFQMLGRVRIDHAIQEGGRLSASKHNEKVEKNRRIVGRLIDSICFLGRQELAIRGHDESSSSVNKGNYLELLDLLAIKESLMNDHLTSNSVFKGTSSTIQNELITEITNEMNARIQVEINKSEFISVQADDTTDVSCKSQFTIIVRYIVDNEIKERFLGFFDVSENKKAEGLANLILSELSIRGCKNKLVSQTYDGASVMSGVKGGVQALVKKECPNALFVHCYAHQLNLVMLYCAKQIKEVKYFMCNLSAFHTFFGRSPMRTQVLREKGFQLPHPCDTRWNFHTRGIQTIAKHFNQLRDSMIFIVEDDNFDAETTNIGRGLLKSLKSPKFVYMLLLYKKIFVFVDHLFLVLQSKSMSNISLCNTEIISTIQNLKELRADITIVETIDENRF